ncbi:acetate--CoA ligase family protein [Oceanibacterium hippocampi]|uniref:acetate--CoA ligase family protein n=1 Tax=Oceanibacterium hippocampi TaxID=745714 RepID=UPI00159349A0|nr:acetate--CoA ligase family protein [Oceanibacterium hippocampi]
MSLSNSADIELRALLEPRSIAIIGASADRGKNSGRPVHFLHEHGYEGEVFPVNPKYDEILGWTCYPDIQAVPKPVDLAVVVVPAVAVPEVVSAAARCGARSALIISSGFGEIGGDAAAAEREMIAIARRHGMRVCGPNSTGLINTENHLVTTISQAADGMAATPGGLALVSQSGNFGTFMIDLAIARQIGVSHFVSSGNEADLGFPDYAAFLLNNPKVDVIAGYIESIRDPFRLREVGQMGLNAGKPIVIVKVGRTASGARAALSHTGAIVGDDALCSAMLEQSRILRVETEEELLDVLPMLLNKRLPSGRRVAVLSVSGGGATMVADACEAMGLDVPPLGETTMARLREAVPYYGAVTNPVDLTGQVMTTRGSVGHCLDAVANDDDIDATILFLGMMQKNGEQIADEVIACAERNSKALIVSWVDGPAGPIARLREAGICVTTAPARAGAIALSHAVRYAEWAGLAEPRARLKTVVPTETVHPGTGSTDPARGRELVAALGIPQPRSRTVSTAEDAVQAAEETGYPVVAKLAHPVVAHKTEAGAVRIGLRTAGAVREAFEHMADVGRGLGAEKVVVTVEQQIAAGTEVIVSVRRDPQFGPVLSVGLGGIWTELLRDVAVGVLPMTTADIEAMCRRIQGAAIFDGYRSQPAVDLPFVVDVLQRLGDAALAEPSLSLLEINPLIVHEAGNGGVAVDVLMASDGTAPDGSGS